MTQSEPISMADETKPPRKRRTEKRISFSMSGLEYERFLRLLDLMPEVYSASDAFRQLVREKLAELAGAASAKPSKSKVGRKRR
jgi:hypothetical protein